MGIYIPEHVALRAASNCTEGLSGCLISTYSVGSHGYAQLGWHEADGHKVATTAHRAAYVAYTGHQIPEGMTVDHVCRVRQCVNPEHLRLLSNAENARDNGQVRVNQPVGRPCRQGHPLVAPPLGKAYCRECSNATRRRRRRAQT